MPTPIKKGSTLSNHLFGSEDGKMDPGTLDQTTDRLASKFKVDEFKIGDLDDMELKEIDGEPMKAIMTGEGEIETESMSIATLPASSLAKANNTPQLYNTINQDMSHQLEQVNLRSKLNMTHMKTNSHLTSLGMGQTQQSRLVYGRRTMQNSPQLDENKKSEFPILSPKNQLMHDQMNNTTYQAFRGTKMQSPNATNSISPFDLDPIQKGGQSQKKNSQMRQTMSYFNENIQSEQDSDLLAVRQSVAWAKPSKNESRKEQYYIFNQLAQQKRKKQSVKWFQSPLYTNDINATGRNLQLMDRQKGKKGGFPFTQNINKTSHNGQKTQSKDVLTAQNSSCMEESSLATSPGVKAKQSLNGVDEDNDMQPMLVTDKSELLELDTSLINIRSVSKMNWSTNSIVPNPDRLRYQNQTSLGQHSRGGRKTTFQKNKQVQNELMEQFKTLDVPKNAKIQIIDASIEMSKTQSDEETSTQNFVEIKHPNLQGQTRNRSNMTTVVNNQLHHFSTGLQQQAELRAFKVNDKHGHMKTMDQMTVALNKIMCESQMSAFKVNDSSNNGVSQSLNLQVNSKKRNGNKLNSSVQIDNKKSNPFSPKIQTHYIKEPVNSQYNVQYDMDKVKQITKYIELPHLVKVQPQTTKNAKPLSELEKKVSLPRDMTYSNDEQYTDIDVVRNRLRKNEYDHLNFDPSMKHSDAAYFKDIYSPTYQNQDQIREGKEEQQFFFCSTLAKDKKKKDELLKVSKPLNMSNVNEVDANQSRAHALKEKKAFEKLARGESDGETSEDEEESDEVLDEIGPLPKELEKDFYTYLLKYCDNWKKIEKGNDTVPITQIRGGNQHTEEKTAEQKEMEHHFKIMINNISIQSMFKQFKSTNHLIDEGESKINLMQSQEIESKIAASGALNKFQPSTYQGSLRQFIHEINEKLDTDYMIDEDLIKKLLSDQIIVRGDSIFDKKVFANIKDHILGSRYKVPTKSAPPKKLKIDANKELKKFSPLELDHVKDLAIEKETIRLKKIDRLLTMQKTSALLSGNKVEDNILQAPTELNPKETIQHFKIIRQMEKEKIDIRRKMLQMTKRELRQFKKQQKERLKHQQVIPQESMDSYNQVVKKQQNQQYFERLDNHRMIIRERIEGDEFAPQRSIQFGKDIKYLDFDQMCNIADEMDDYIAIKNFSDKQKKKKEECDGATDDLGATMQVQASLALKQISSSAANKSKLLRLKTMEMEDGISPKNVSSSLVGQWIDPSKIPRKTTLPKTKMLRDDRLSTVYQGSDEPIREVENEGVDLDKMLNAMQNEENELLNAKKLHDEEKLKLVKKKINVNFAMNNKEIQDKEQDRIDLTELADRYKQEQQQIKKNESNVDSNSPINKKDIDLGTKSHDISLRNKNITIGGGSKSIMDNYDTMQPNSPMRLIMQKLSGMMSIEKLQKIKMKSLSPENIKNINFQLPHSFLGISKQRTSSKLITKQESYQTFSQKAALVQQKRKSSKNQIFEELSEHTHPFATEVTGVSTVSPQDLLKIEQRTMKKAGETKAQILRREANNMKMQTLNIKQFINKQLIVKNKKYDLNVVHAQTSHRDHKLSARENMLKNSITFDQTNLLKQKDKISKAAQTKAIKKAVAIKGIQKHQKNTDLPIYQTNIRSINNIQKSVEKKDNRKVTINDDLDFDIVKTVVTKKFQIAQEFDKGQKLKYVKKIETNQYSTDITKNKQVNEIKNVIRADSDQFIEYVRIKDRVKNLVPDIVGKANQNPLRTKSASSLAINDSSHHALSFQEIGPNFRIMPLFFDEADLQKAGQFEWKRRQKSVKEVLSNKDSKVISNYQVKKTLNFGPTQSFDNNISPERPREDSWFESIKGSISQTEPSMRDESLFTLESSDDVFNDSNQDQTSSNTSNSQKQKRIHMIRTQKNKIMNQVRNHLSFTLDNVADRRRGTIMPLMRHGTLGAGMTKHLSPKKAKVLNLTLNQELNIYNQKSVMSKLTDIVKEMNDSPANYKQMQKKYAKVTSKLDTNIDNIKQMKIDQKQSRLDNAKKDLDNEKRSTQNRKNMHIIMRTLEKEFTKRDWLDKTTPIRDFEKVQIEEQEQRITQAITDYLKLDSLVELTELNRCLKVKDIKELLPSYIEIIAQNIKRAKCDYDNFLSPASILKFQKINNDNSVTMLNGGNKTRIWKPDKVKLNYKTFKEVLQQDNAAQK